MELRTSNSIANRITYQDWGLIDFFKATEKQLKLVETIHIEDQPGTIVFCSHPEIVTIGRATEPGDLFSWDGPVAEISRGGRATYHGPSQLVIYPIINLKHSGRPLTEHQNVIGHLRNLENGIIHWLQTLRIQGQGKTLDAMNRLPQRDYKGNNVEETGVWVGGKKIASLGIAVKKWVTYHGAAININNDESAFRGLYPCGFSNSVMTNVETILQKKIDLENEKAVLAKILVSKL